MGPRDKAHTAPADDDFLRQLAADDLVDPQAPSSDPVAPKPDATAGGPLDPHAVHPIVPPQPQPWRRRPRQPPRQQDPVGARRSSPDPGLRRRLLAATALGVGVLAVTMVVLGADQRRPSQATATDPRGAPNGTPAAEEVSLRAWWSQDGTSSLRKRWRRDAEALVEGRLASGAGEAIAGAMVTILAADATRRDAVNRTVGEVRTDREGRFEAAIAIDQGAPRKRLTFSYVAHANDTVPSARARATLAVIPPVTLEADQRGMSRGEAVRLDGRTVPNARISLEVRPPGSDQWRQLDEVQADRDGDWWATVRAPRDASPGRWRFRARAARSPQDGYLAADSRPVGVEVR